MKVVLKETVFDRILERIAAVKRENRLVDHIVVSDREYRELRDDYRTDRHLRYPHTRWINEAPARDATFRVWDFPVRPSHRGRPGTNPHIRVASHDEFMGYPLVVVPEPYMPD